METKITKNSYLIIKNEKYTKLNQLISSEHKNYLKLIAKYSNELFYFEKKINSNKSNNPINILQLLENQQQLITQLISIINNFLVVQKKNLPKKNQINLKLSRPINKDITVISKTNENNTTNLDTTSNIYSNSIISNCEKITEVKTNSNCNLIQQFQQRKIVNLKIQKHSNETLLNQYINKQRSNNLILNFKDFSKNFSKSSSCSHLCLHSTKNNRNFSDINFILSQSYNKKLTRENSTKLSRKCKSIDNFDSMKTFSNFESSIGNVIYKNKNNRNNKNNKIQSEKSKFYQIKPSHLTELLLRRSYFFLNQFERKRKIDTFFSKSIGKTYKNSF